MYAREELIEAICETVKRRRFFDGLSQDSLHNAHKNIWKIQKTSYNTHSNRPSRHPARFIDNWSKKRGGTEYFTGSAKTRSWPKRK